jgi:hypothetical protein
MANRLKCVEEIIGEVQRLIETSLGGNHVDQQLLVRLKIGAFLDWSAVLERRSRASDQGMNLLAGDPYLLLWPAARRCFGLWNS